MIALKRATTHQLEKHSSNCKNHKNTEFVESFTHDSPWNVRILFVNFSAQSSLSTSRVGYKSCSFSTSSQELSLSMSSHWWSRVISASQFRHLDFSDDTLEGVKANGAGEGNFLTYGETRRGDRLIIGGVSGERWLLSNSFSGDSISSSPIWKSLGQRGKVWGRKDSWRRVSFWQLVYSLQAWTRLGFFKMMGNVGKSELTPLNGP